MDTQTHITNHKIRFVWHGKRLKRKNGDEMTRECETAILDETDIWIKFDYSSGFLRLFNGFLFSYHWTLNATLHSDTRRFPMLWLLYVFCAVLGPQKFIYHNFLSKTKHVPLGRQCEQTNLNCILMLFITKSITDQVLIKININ